LQNFLNRKARKRFRKTAQRYFLSAKRLPVKTGKERGKQILLPRSLIKFSFKNQKSF
jgi:hypothetical protein